MCNKEIWHAERNGKRILPIFVSNVDVGKVNNSFLTEEARKEISKRNYLFCRPGTDDFNSVIEEIKKTIHTDYDWLKYHTKLQLQALDWEKQRDDSSKLLRDKGLKQAIQKLLDYQSQEDPRITTLQYEFVQASRENQERRRTLSLVLAACIGLLLLALGVYAQFQNKLASVQEATAQAAKTSEAAQFKTAQALSTKRVAAEATSQVEFQTALLRKLTSQALAHSNQDFDLALLLSVEANNIQPSAEAWNALVTLLEEIPHNNYQPAPLSEVTALAYSPDGKTLAIGGRAELDSAILIFDMNNGSLISELDYPDAFTVFNLAFDSTGRLLAASYDTDVVLWDVETKSMYTKPLTSDECGLGITNLGFSPNNKTLFVACDLGPIQEWDLEKIPPTERLFQRNLDITVAMAINRDRTILGIVDLDGNVSFWDTQTHQQIGKPTKTSGSNTRLALDPSGRILAMNDDFNGIELWNILESHVEKNFTIPADTSVAMGFSADGKALAVAGSNQEIYLWSTTTYEPIKRRLDAHDKPITSLSFSIYNNRLASADNGGTVIEWNLIHPPLLVKTLVDETGIVRALVFNKSGKELFSAGDDGSINAWDTMTWQLSGASETGLAKSIYELALEPGEDTLVTRDKTGMVTKWDSKKLKPLNQTFQISGESISSFAINLNGNILATGSKTGTIFLWDLKTHQIISRLVGNTSSITNLAFSPDGTKLASASLDHSLIIWDWKNNKMDGDKFGEFIDFISNVAFSPDGRMLVTGSCAQLGKSGVLCQKGKIEIWDTSSHQLIVSMSGHTDLVNAVAFSPDGKLLASASLEGTIILWDANTHQMLGRPFESDASSISSLAFDPLSDLLAAGGNDGRIYVCDVSPESWKIKACALAKRNLSQEEWKIHIPEESYQITCPQWPTGQ